MGEERIQQVDAILNNENCVLHAIVEMCIRDRRYALPRNCDELNTDDLWLHVQCEFFYDNHIPFNKQIRLSNGSQTEHLNSMDRHTLSLSLIHICFLSIVT